MQIRVGRACGPKLIFTPFDPVTLTFDHTLPKNVATGGKAKVNLWAKFGGLGLIFKVFFSCG